MAEDGDVRELLLARKSLICPRCGNLRAECSDPTRDWHPRTDVCWASATSQWALRKLAKDNAKAEVGDNELGYLDGRWLWVSEQPPPADEDEFA